MKKHFILVLFAFITIGFTTCDPPLLEVNTQLLQEEIYEPDAIRYERLQSGTVLYLDHSTCVIDARKNSQVFNALRPQLGQYSDTLRLIKGDAFEVVPLSSNPSTTLSEIHRVLETITEDIPYSNILKAVEQICSSNQQAILITDCEFIEESGLCHDQDPYLSRPFKDWMHKGHTIYIVVESYQEKNKANVYDKKRFYFIFTDDRIQAPISHNMLGEIEPLLQDGSCKLFKLTNSDIFVRSPKSDMVADALTFNVEYGNGYEYVEISDNWNVISQYVMKLDKYGQPLPQEEPVPLVKNLAFNDGENYIIDSVKIIATNITEKYLSIDSVAAYTLKLNYTTIGVNDIDISEGFMLDKDTFQNHKLNVMLTDKIFTNGYLFNKYGGNLIRLDFVITDVGLKSHDNTMFEWQSIWSPNMAICVSKSIDNALRDVAVVPTCPNRRVIHTIFIKTESY
jgi:hypothetical protein